MRNRLPGKTPDTFRKVGPASALGYNIKNKLVEWILDGSAGGFSINKEGFIPKTS